MSYGLDRTVQSAIEFAVPLWLAGLGELVVQRSGVINIGIEGIMLCGALVAWVVTVMTGSAWLGLLAAAVAGLALAAIFALATLVFNADQVVAGTAMNMLALGATGVGFKLAIDAGLDKHTADHFRVITLKFLPFDALNQFSLFYLAILLAVVLHWLLANTRWGIELKALGDYPAAAHAAGVRVNARRFWAVLFGGVAAGLAGSYLSIMFIREFNPKITAGRGFLALAMVIFGRWHPLGVLAGGLFFGFVYAVEIQLEVSPVGWLPAPQLLQMAPYLLTLLVLAGWAGRTRSPAALGRPFGSDEA